MQSARSHRWRNALAKYDAAQTTDENMRHWAMADGLSADAANSPEVRRTLRNRARYEVANNAYAKSLVDTLATAVMGTGPRLRIDTGDKRVNKKIKRRWRRWTKAVGLPRKLITLRKAKCRDGEGFALFIQNPKLGDKVKLDLRLIESEQVATPTMTGLEKNSVDGIRFDEAGNPRVYDILREHPGSSMLGGMGHAGQADQVDAQYVLHMFRADRPGQHRGIPELTPALPLFAQLRRYVLAVLAAAETAADFAAVIQTSQPIDPGNGMPGSAPGGVAPDPMDVFDLAQRMVTVLPDGYQLGQIRAEQPAFNYFRELQSCQHPYLTMWPMRGPKSSGISTGRTARPRTKRPDHLARSPRLVSLTPQKPGTAPAGERPVEAFSVVSRRSVRSGRLPRVLPGRLDDRPRGNRPTIWTDFPARLLRHCR
ncbi:MAG: phage portal protein [bacterium]|nr:phage portal protein [bacterium]